MNKVNLDGLLAEITTLMAKAEQDRNWEPYQKAHGHLKSALRQLKEAENENEPLSFKSVQDQEQVFEIFGDGACSGNPGPGGWGSIIRHNGQTHELSGFYEQTTNNIMEMTAALEAIKQTPAKCRIELYSDSNYLVQGMNSWLKGWKKRNWKKADGAPVLNKSLWQALDKENSKRQIRWNWVKGHSGHVENERCDALARQAIKDNLG